MLDHKTELPHSPV